MRGFVLAAVVVVASGSVAHAQGLGLAPPVNTFSISYMGHMEVITTSSDSAIWAVQDNGFGTAHHSATGPGDWTRVRNPSVRISINPPLFVDLRFFSQTGLAGFDAAPRRADSERLYAVSNPEGVPAAVESQLWEFSPVTGRWRSLGRPPGVSLGSSPAISAVLISGIIAWVAVRASNGHVYTCDYIDFGTQNCNWIDRDPTGAHLAATTSDVAIVDGPVGPHIFTVRPNGVAEMFEVATRTWTDLPAPRPGFTVSPGGISAVSLGNTDLRIAAGAHTGGQVSDSLFVATTRDRGRTFTWEEMLAPGEGAFAYHTAIRNTLHMAARNFGTSGRPVFDVAVYADAVSLEDGSQVLVPCLLPSRFGVTNGVRSCVDDITDGALRNMPLPGDLDPQTSFLGYSVTGVVLPPGQFGISSFRAFTTGVLANVGYVYQFDSTAEGIDGLVWNNLLAPHADFASLALSPPNICPSAGSVEFDGDEFFGDVALMDTCGNYWRSRDDGNSWSGPGVVWANQYRYLSVVPGCGLAANVTDSNLGFDGHGNLYVTSLSDATNPGSGPRSITISRLLPGQDLGACSSDADCVPSMACDTTAGNCSPRPVVVPQSVSVSTTIDRPWLEVFGDDPSMVMLSWERDNDQGYFAYCNGGNCASATGSWCPTTEAPSCNPDSEPKRYALPSDCDGFGCPIARAGDGRVWIAMSGDFGCCMDPPRGQGGCPGHANVGFRFITNLEEMIQGCTAPTFSPPTCLYLDGADPSQISPGGALVTQGRWPNSLSAAGDDGDILYTVQVARDLSGGPCDAPSVDPRCRIETMLFHYHAESGQWCGVDGSSCVSGPEIVPGAAFIANRDALSGEQSEDSLPVAAMFDFGYATVHWMDFRDSALLAPRVHDDRTFAWRRLSVRYSGQAGHLVSGVTESAPWPATRVPLTYPLIARAFGDVDRMAVARLHGHSVHDLTPGATPADFTVMESPRVPPR